MKEIRKQEKGITLIALVLTIIVLMILVAVSVATLTGENGILTQADNAKTAIERAEIIERAQTDILGVQAENNGDITERQLNEILGKYGIVSGEGKDKMLTTDKGYIIKVSDIWNGTLSAISLLAKDVLKTDATATEEKDKSPYVKYNGLDCRVLYNDKTHGIQIITTESVGNVTLGSGDTEVEASDFTYDGTATVDDNFKKAAASYNNVVDNLNKKAKTYMDSKGIATDARCLGSVSTLTSGAKFQKDSSEMWSGTYTYLETYSWNNIFKTTDTNYSEDVNRLNTLGLNVSSGYAWLASRLVHSYSGGSYFHVRRVDTVGKASDVSSCGAYSSGNPFSNAPSNGFRPVFLLPSNVVISSGDGSSGNPYNIE